MREIHFRFDPEKLVAALTFLASRNVPDLDVMKSLKLLYFADKAHLLKYGRPILGDDYYGMKDGPVASNAYNVMKDAIGENGAAPQSLMHQYLKVETVGEHHHFVAVQPPDMDVLSESDVEILDATIREYGDYPALELRRLAHQEPDVRHADEERARSGRLRADMPYRLFFSDTDQKMLAIVEEDQEADEFAQSLAW